MIDLSSRIAFCFLSTLSLGTVSSVAVQAEVLFSEDFESYAEGSNLYQQGGWGDHPFYGDPPRDYLEETLTGQGAGLSSKVSNGRINTGSGWIGYVVQPIAVPSGSDIYTLSFDAYAYSTPPNSHVAHFGFVFDDGSVIVWQAVNNPANPSTPDDAWKFTVDPVTGNQADNTYYQGGFDRPAKFEIVIDASNRKFYGRYDFGTGFQNTPTFSLTQAQVDEINGLLLLNDYRQPGSYLGIEVDNIVLARAEVLFSEDFESYAEGSNLYQQGGWGDHPFYGDPPRDYLEETLTGQGAGLSSKVSNGRINTGSGWIGYVVQPIAVPSGSDIYTLSFDAYAYSTPPNSHVAHFGFVFDDGSVIVWQAVNNPANPSTPDDAWKFTVDPVTGNQADNTYYQGGFDRPAKFEIVIDASNRKFYGRYDFGTGFQNTPTFSLTQAQVDEINGLLLLNDYRQPGSYLGIEVDNIFLTNIGGNEAPVADAGADQSIRAGDNVLLDGTSSFDDNTATEDLVYAWSFSSVPGGSAATLTDGDTITPSFVADVAGTYAVKLIVTDEDGLDSAADEAMISSDNLAPTAVAGDDQLVIIGNFVDLDGSGSSDPETDALTFAWAITSAPASSVATLSGDGTAMPSFLPDLEGGYEVTLTVGDFIGPGAPDTVAVTVASAEDFAEIQIVSAGDLIVSLTAGQVTTGGNQNALTNFLSQAVVALQANPPDVAKAINKLEKALARTDGCVLRGSPDGNGPGKDWIIDCEAQTDIYAALSAALDALEP